MAGSVASVTINIHDRPYQVVCEGGQEDHVRKLAAYIDQRVRELASKSGVPGPAGQITEARLLVMASLLIADELGEAYDEIETLRNAPPKTVPDPATLKAADEARSVASAARAQLAEVEARLRAVQARATQAEAALQATAARAAAAEAKLREIDAERATMRATLASLEATSLGARAGDEALAAGLDALAQQLEGFAERLERGAAR